jgi:hypothetical protein
VTSDTGAEAMFSNPRFGGRSTRNRRKHLETLNLLSKGDGIIIGP